MVQLSHKGLMVNILPTNVGDVGSIPGLGRSLGEENDISLQYSCLGNLKGKGAWWDTVHGMAKSWTQLSH